jgi:hypothetical protein
VSSVALAPDPQRERYAQKSLATYLPEVPKADAFLGREDRRSQIQMRSMRWRRSNANA